MLSCSSNLSEKSMLKIKYNILLPTLLIMYLMVFALFPVRAFAANNVDASIQAALAEYLQKYKSDEGITAIQASVLMPNQAQPRDYVIGTMSKEPNSDKATTNSIIQWGSITKAFTSSVLLKLELQSENKSLKKEFNLDQTVGYWLPEYFANKAWPQSWKKVKIKQLLNMTAGIPDILASKAFRKKYSEDFHHDFSLDETIQYVADLEKQAGCNASIHCFAPGTSYYYGNTGYLIAAKIAEKVSGDSFVNLMRLLLSDAASKSGANNIFYYHANLPTTIIEKMINGYYEYLPDQVFYIPSGTNVTTATLSVVAPAGGIVSSTHNMVLAVHALLNGKLLPPAKMAELNRFICTDEDSNKSICTPGQEVSLDLPGVNAYGLGTGAENGALGKTWVYQGSFIGYRSLYIWVKSDDILVGVTANSASTGKSDHLSALALKLYRIAKSAK